MELTSGRVIDVPEVLSTLEVVADQRPDALPGLVELLRQSPARVVLTQLVNDWRAETGGKLAEIARKASTDLDRIERRRVVPWDRFGLFIVAPNIPALRDFAWQRSRRFPSIPSKSHRLKIIAHRLGRLSEADRQRRKIEQWIAAPIEPIDPVRLAEFLRPRTNPTGGSPKGGQ